MEAKKRPLECISAIKQICPPAFKPLSHEKNSMAQVSPDEGKCNKCPKDAKITLPYGPHKYCAEHFSEFFQSRVRKTIRMNRLVKYGEKIAVGVSGGKDSMVTLHLLSSIFGKSAMNKIEAIMVDEGIEGYRQKAIDIAANYCRANAIPFHIVKVKDAFGTSMDGVMAKFSKKEAGSACSFCGVFRRQLLNSKALEIKADKLATGHNLDDECQSIAMSLFGNDLARLSRLGEIAGGRKAKGFVPRIKPLYEIPEKEIIAYALFNGIGFYGDECCPYSWMAKRNQYRKALNGLEDSMPGTKFSILASFRSLKPLLAKAKAKPIEECSLCGSPSNSSICATCRQLGKIAKLQGNDSAKQTIDEIPKGALGCAVSKGVKQPLLPKG